MGIISWYLKKRRDAQSSVIGGTYGESVPAETGFRQYPAGTPSSQIPGNLRDGTELFRRALHDLTDIARVGDAYTNLELADRAAIEAKSELDPRSVNRGIADAQRIIAQSLIGERGRAYLSWKYLENLKNLYQSPNNTIVISPFDMSFIPLLQLK